MAIHPEQLHRELIRAGRAARPSDAVPPFFAARVLARIASSPVSATLSHWSSGLWRAALPCALFSLTIAGWTMITSASTETDWSEEFENAVIVAAIEHETETSW